MQLLEVHLQTSDLSAQRAFYSGVLGLPVHADNPERLLVQIGTTALVFERAAAALAGPYHLAFNIPPRQFSAAADWLSARVPLLPNGQERLFRSSPGWNAQMMYFLDPAGNILELIARHALPGSSPEDDAFGPQSLLCVSEVGLAVEDVEASARELAAVLGLAPYQETSDTFKPLGDEHGLLIVVASGRPWFPTTRAAFPLPLKVLAVTPGTGRVARSSAEIVGQPE
ncbi:VOC family protein [Deinococcus sp.]|uniref:VOC family protein n=1 Tax=Deinococcus sp. TaxID=47478 RepID=UPI003CC6A9A4